VREKHTPADIPLLGAPAKTVTAAQMARATGWDYEGYYSRWSEALGIDIIISTLLLAVGSYFHFESMIQGTSNKAALPSSSSSSLSLTLAELGYSKLVEDGFFWKLNKTEGERMAVGPDDIMHRWKEALRRARAKLTPAFQARIHTLSWTHGMGSEGVCLQIYRGAPTEDVAPFVRPSVVPQWMRFVPYEGRKGQGEEGCRCCSLQHVPTPFSAVKEEGGAAVPQKSLAEQAEVIYPHVLSVLKQHPAGAFTPLPSLASSLFSSPSCHSSFLLLLPHLHRMHRDFEVKQSLLTMKEEDPFFQRLDYSEEGVGRKEITSSSLTPYHICIMLEYILHCQRFHGWLMGHEVRVEMAMDRKEVGSAPILSLSLLPFLELSRRARTRHILVHGSPPEVRFPVKEMKQVTMNYAAIAGVAGRKGEQPGKGKEGEKKQATGKKPTQILNTTGTNGSAAASSSPHPAPSRPSPSSFISPDGSFHLPPSSSSSPSPAASSSSPSSSSSSDPSSSSSSSLPSKKSPVSMHDWNSPDSDSFSFLPSSGRGRRYTRKELAALYKGSQHLHTISPDSAEWTKSGGPIDPMSFSLISPPIRALLVKGKEESGAAFLHRVVFEGFLPYALDRWMTDAQMKQILARLYPELKTAWKEEGVKGKTLEEWIFTPIQVQFDAHSDPSISVPTYIRAQMLQQHLRIARRLPSSAVAGDGDVDMTAVLDPSNPPCPRYQFTKKTSLIPRDATLMPEEEKEEGNAAGAKRRKLTAGATPSTQQRPDEEEHKSAIRRFAGDAADDDGAMMEDTVPASALECELSVLRTRHRQLEQELSDLTRCGSCVKRLKGVCIFPCSHIVWCERCTIRNLSGHPIQLEDGRLVSLPDGPNAPKYVCPLTRCSRQIQSLIRVRPTPPP
jgi:uncharacterized protein YigA (DUF484 family)